MTVVILYGFVALLAATFFVLLRMARGPSMFDRVVALDILTAVMLGTVVLISVAFERSDLVAVLIVLSVIGFVGSVSVARFAKRESTEEGRILSREELAAVTAEQERRTDEDAPVHDPDAPQRQPVDAEGTPPYGPSAAAEMDSDDDPARVPEKLPGPGGDRFGAIEPGVGHEVHRHERRGR